MMIMIFISEEGFTSSLTNVQTHLILNVAFLHNNTRQKRQKKYHPADGKWISTFHIFCTKHK